MQRGVANKARTIRIPVHIVEREQKIARAERELTPSSGRPPTDEEIAKAREAARSSRCARCGDAARAVTSLDKPIGERRGRGTLGDLIARRPGAAGGGGPRLA